MPSKKEETISKPTLAEIEAFRNKLEMFAPTDGSYELPFEGVRIFRASAPYKTANRSVSEPAICIPAQGVKTAMQSGKVYEYDMNHMMVYSLDVPVSVQITKASRAKPYLCLVLPLRSEKIGELVSKVFPYGLPKTDTCGGLYAAPTEANILAALIRMLDCVQDPKDMELLAPLAFEEIFIRLLRSPIGVRLAQIGKVNSSAHKISKVTNWLRTHFKEPIKIEELSEIAGMSASSFHQHFKTITSMSPLQFQKALRLQEARRLMLMQDMDASTVSGEVGYASASQFSREYSRYFGQPPSKDVTELRGQNNAVEKASYAGN